MPDETAKNPLRLLFLPAALLGDGIARSIEWAKSIRLWLGLLAAVLIMVGGVAGLLWAQGETSGAFWTLVGLSVLVTYWALIALVAWNEVGWVRRVNALVVLTGGFGIVIAMMMAGGFEGPARTLGVIYLTIAGFMVGVNVLRIILIPGYPMLGVARTMIEEALRMRVAVVIIITYLVGLSLMPMILGSEDRVTYMVQRFLVYASGLIIFSLGLLTVLLGAYSVSRELSTRQVQMTLTKPLARWQYLLGKWLGIMLLNAVLVGVAGVAIYGFAGAIASNPELDRLDRYKVEREVLTARERHSPVPIDVSWEQMYANVLAEKQARDPEKFGRVGDSFAVLPNTAKQEVISDAVSRFYTVDTGKPQKYVFTGLNAAADAAQRAIEEAGELLQEESALTAEESEQFISYALGRSNDLSREVFDKVTPSQQDALQKILEREVIQLVLVPDTAPEPTDQQVEVLLRFNGQPWPRASRVGGPAPTRKLVIETPNEIPVPASMIDTEGRLVVTIEVPGNRTRDGLEQKYIQFNYKDAEISLFYRVASFEANLARAMFVVWLKLAFLAMLGLVLGSLLSFPVAAMIGIVIFIAALVSGVIQESLDSYASVGRGEGTWDIVTGFFGGILGALGEGDIYGIFKLILRLIGETFMLLVPSFGQYGTADPLSSGKIISNDLLLGAFLKIGLLWTGVVGTVGIYFFSKKELARVTA